MTRILLVDDDSDLRDVLSILLESIGFEVVIASSGQEALLKFDAAKIDIVLTDVKMPGMDGIELCKRLKAIALDLNLYFMSGFSSLTTETARNLGARGVFSKPFEVESFIATIKSSTSF